MTLVSVPQVNPNDEVTALSVNQGPNAIANVVNGGIDDTNIASISGSKLASSTVPASAMTADANPETRMSETLANSVASGLVWSLLSGLNGAMTAGVAYVLGKRLSVGSVSSYAFTASRDTYIYINSTGGVDYNPVANNAAQPATPSSSVLVAKVVTGASAITSVTALPGKPVSADKIDYQTMKYPFPDYGSSVGIAANTYIAPSNGFIVLRGLAATNVVDSAAVASISGVEVYRLQWSANTTNYNVQTTAVIPIAKGDTVTFTLANSAQWSTRVFVPVKV